MYLAASCKDITIYSVQFSALLFYSIFVAANIHRVKTQLQLINIIIIILLLSHVLYNLEELTRLHDAKSFYCINCSHE